LIGTAAGSLAWLMRFDQAVGTTAVLFDAYGQTGTRRWFVERTGSGQFRLGVFDSGSIVNAMTAVRSEVTDVGVWHHWALTWDATGADLYLDGVQQARLSGNYAALRDWYTVYFRHNNDAAPFWPHGSYCALTHLTRTLTASEVSDIARLALKGESSVKDGTLYARQSLTEGAF
jgi:hypothetical protein